MKAINSLFLEALRASLTANKVTWTRNQVSAEDLSALIHIASIHHVVPMIFESIYSCDAFQALHPQQVMGLRRSVTRSIMLQTMKTEEFKALFGKLKAAGFKPCVVKGVICRGLYPSPDARSSGDEDVLIRPEDFCKVHELFLEHGMALVEEEQDIEEAYEVPYIQSNGQLYIELHKSLFPPKSEAYGDMNKFFTSVHDRVQEVTVGDFQYYSMCPTDHLLYLICHSFKHFLHSGFGIRQVCDIILFANAYGKEIDWKYVLESCREIRADLFAASMFKMGEKYLVFDPDKACYSDDWRAIDVDERAMLDDLLESGVFGQSNMSRKHSSNITLNAVIADKRGEKAKSGKIRNAIKAVCLPVDKLSGRFPYLKKMPFLLPIAWIQRVWIYKKETAGKQESNNAADSIKIGNERIELMRKYGIIK